MTDRDLLNAKEEKQGDAALSILLIGAGGHAMSCIDVLEQSGKYAIAGLLARAEEVGRTILGYRVLGDDGQLSECLGLARHALIAVGQMGAPIPRAALFRQALEAGFEMPAIVSPHAYVSPHAQLGAGTIVMHGAVINAGARIGANCIVNSRTLVEHGASVGDHCHLATGAIVNGDATVGEASFIGSGSVLKEGVVLGKRCLVGMGLSVRHHQANDARIVRSC